MGERVATEAVAGHAPGATTGGLEPWPPAGELVELRLLDGPNLYFPRAAAKLSLRIDPLERMDLLAAAVLATRLGIPGARPGLPGTQQRQRFVLRVLVHLTRRIAATAGTSRLAVRARPGAGTGEAVVAFPWRHHDRALALGRALEQVLVGVGARDADIGDLLVRAGRTVREAPSGREPAALRPAVPVVSITGTNGKTTTTRLVAHIAMTAGLHTGWSSTDGVVVDGVTVEPGDYSGPAGARAVLETPGVQLAVLETARGGLLLRGMGVVANDVSVVTNISADHLGLQGIDTLDQLAEVKAVVTRVTRPGGWVVLNGDDPRVLAMRTGSPARPWVFSLDPASPALREAVNEGGRGITVLDGDLTVLASGADPDRLLPVLDVPVALAGLSEHNLANALAAAAAALGLGLPRDAVVNGLRTFRPDPALNPGRMNLYSLPVAAGGAANTAGDVTAILDLAHNEAGLEALLRVCRGVRAPGGRVLLGLGTAGDRTEAILHALGEIAGRGADRVVIVHKEKYLRGRTIEEMDSILRQGLAAVGVHDVPSFSSELAGLQHLLAEAGPGDVAAMMTQAERAALDAWLRDQGATPDGPDEVRAKVVTARGEHRLDDQLARARSSAPGQRISAIEALLAENPADPHVLFELASAHDQAGQHFDAIVRYREALAAGLPEPQRTSGRLQLADCLRALGRPGEALAELDSLLTDNPTSTAAVAFRSLALRDLGRSDQAVADLLREVASMATGGDAEPYADELRSHADELAPPTE